MGARTNLAYALGGMITIATSVAGMHHCDTKINNLYNSRPEIARYEDIPWEKDRAVNTQVARQDEQGVIVIDSDTSRKYTDLSRELESLANDESLRESNAEITAYKAYNALWATAFVGGLFGLGMGAPFIRRRLLSPLKKAVSSLRRNESGDNLLEISR